MGRTVITGEPESSVKYLRKIWQHRSLIKVFAVRDIKVKYAQTVLGFAWSIINPFTALVIFTVFFGSVLHWDADGLPYSLYVLSGLLGWNFFSYIVVQGAHSIQESSELIKKIYFPKAILPLSKVCVALVELGITVLLFVPLLLWHQQGVSWHIVFVPVVLLFNALIALFLVFFISALASRKRDVFHLVPFLMYFGIWLTPVFFTKGILPPDLSLVWYFNPMAAVAEGWRWCLFPNWGFDVRFVPALMAILPLFVIGVAMYKRVEKEFSDYV